MTSGLSTFMNSVVLHIFH